MKNHIKEILFEEKYRPQKLDDMILPERLKVRFKNGLSDFPRVLLYSSSPGSGKCIVNLTKVKLRNKSTSNGKKMQKWYHEALSLKADARRCLRSKTFPGFADALANQYSNC